MQNMLDVIGERSAVDFFVAALPRQRVFFLPYRLAFVLCMLAYSIRITRCKARAMICLFVT